MKRFLPLIVAVSGLFLGAVVIFLLPDNALFHHHADEAAADRVDGHRYACPMMCFIGYREAECPVCGMDMTPVSAGDLNAEQVRRINLETAIADTGPAIVSVRAFGRADYDHRYSQLVIPRVSGRIVQRFEATFGCCETVEIDAPIIELYSPEVIAAQGELQAALRHGDPRLIRSLTERFQRWNLGAIADQILAGEAIQETIIIRSPFEGTVLLEDEDMLNDTLVPGREITADFPLLRLVNPNQLVIILEIPEARAIWLAENQPVLLATDQRGPLTGIEARINRLSTEIERQMRTREVRIYLSNVGDQIIPGALVEARIQAALTQDLQPADYDDPDSWGQFVRIPKSAVLSTGIRNVAWKIAERHRDGRVEFALAPLALGPRIEDPDGNDWFIVRAGLEAGEEVATTGAFLIDSQAQLAGTASLLYPAGSTQAPATHDH